jgi:SIR2-like domain
VSLADPEESVAVPAQKLEEETWATLVDSILAEQCTPFLGAGVAWPDLPTGRTLSAELAAEHGYPLADAWNLPRVTQYLATVYQPTFAKRRVAERIRKAQLAYLDSNDGQAPPNYRVLAKLGFPLLVTTNCDGFLERALTAFGRQPRVETCRWNDQLLDELGDYPQHEPTPDQPMVFHLHGQLDNEASLLVTEDDYIDFTVNLALRTTEQAVLWHRVRRALSRTSLLFVGYSLEDWNFRVLMRYLMKQQKVVRSEQSFSLSIQLPDHGMHGTQRLKAEKFLNKYLGNSAIQVHWSDAAGFLDELSARVEAARR